ncbi:PepSY-associated TM helix domain-containing protein [Aquabacterium sp. OR-4]|uniref:PepSY-associated TM helix domain-containing protein n=1 Tax=Aquabacterium sp. OR-4 TaxID=2978127 RepID=UPI0028C5667C|nr:PepSY-associated TM helix domain-containing protein [Aquabacterium sp. OR-4]MDT7836654.1 PepSY-associated TM helix domain-containing protein [Aquabacterium sp. OR-4]
MGADLTPTPSTPRRPRWHLGSLHRWHWISSAVALAGMLLFAITGFTLNHAADIEARPVLRQWQARLPAELLAQVQRAAAPRAPLPPVLGDWLAQQRGLRVPPGASLEWRDDELYIGMPRPGGDAWLRLTLGSGNAAGELEFEDSDRGWLAWANDLHKGRHSGRWWSLFIDLMAVACVVFCITGLLLLQRHARHRPGTWPVTAMGLLLPLLVLLLAVH